VNWKGHFDLNPAELGGKAIIKGRGIASELINEETFVAAGKVTT
jgi:uncharacterized protein (DUF433 family)